MHHNVFLSSEKYERIVLFINLDFFQKHHCPELEHFFTQRKLGWDCLIPANITNRKLFPLLMKMNPRELHKKGQSLLEASANAGYNSYAHFYRMYKSEFGVSPFSSQKNHQYFS